MLKSLIVTEFKCFEQAIVPLGKISLFTGTNSSGKSSAIQALLLLANNAGEISSSPLNSMWLRLGSFEECRNHILNTRAFVLALEDDNDESFILGFKAPEDDNDIPEIEQVKRGERIEELLSPRGKHLYYIPADRYGTDGIYSKNFDTQNVLGSHAEFAVDYLSRYGKNAVLAGLQKDFDSVTLAAQVNYWLKLLFDVNLNIKSIPGSNVYSLEYTKSSGKAVRPYHIGTGISYTLSVIVSCLAAKEGDVVILENPEIHLHPKAQAELTVFLCFVAQAGVQVIVETHSDHVFNGIRKAVVKKVISCEDASIQFFTQNKDGISTNESIQLNEHGRVKNHQKGLFDQFDEDLDAILGI